MKTEYSSPQPSSSQTLNQPEARFSLQIMVSLVINVLAGLIVAFILLFSDTSTKVVLAFSIIGVLILVTSVVVLAFKLREAKHKNTALQNELRSRAARYQEWLSNVGIATVQEMGSGDWSPQAVMSRAHHKVRFVGVFGRKWVSGTTNRAIQGDAHPCPTQRRNSTISASGSQR